MPRGVGSCNGVEMVEERGDGEEREGGGGDGGGVAGGGDGGGGWLGGLGKKMRGYKGHFTQKIKGIIVILPQTNGTTNSR